MSRSIRSTSVAVIGGAGFLGSHVVDHLVNDRNCHVLVLDNLVSGQMKHVHKKAKFEWFDIRESRVHLLPLLQEHRVQYVFNYAAEPYIPECFSRPEYFFAVNATGVLEMLQVCDRAEIKGILQVSSAEIYGDCKDHGAINESAPLEPHSTYGASKIAADSLVQVRWREAKTPAIAMRQFNCVGERETHEYVIPEVISQLTTHKGKEAAVVRLGNNSVRDFQYAGDAARMAVELLERGQFGEVYNMGSETCIHIHDLAKLLGELMGFTSVEIETNPAKVRPWEIWHLLSDNTKLYKTIEARPQVPMVEALKRTIAYFKSNGNKWDW